MKMKTKKLKLVFGLMATQTEEITVRSKEEGWDIKAVDPSHTSMIHAVVPRGEFTDYEKTDDFAISLKNILKVLGNAGEECTISSTGGQFVVESDGLKSKFQIINVAETDPKIPDFDTTASATVAVGEIVRISSVYSPTDAYRLDINGGIFTITAEDETKQGTTLMLDKEKCLDISGEAKAVFAIDLLDRLLKALPKDAVITLRLGTDMPLIIEVSDASLTMKYLLAPRVEIED